MSYSLIDSVNKVINPYYKEPKSTNEPKLISDELEARIARAGGFSGVQNSLPYVATTQAYATPPLDDAQRIATTQASAMPSLGCPPAPAGCGGCLDCNA